MNEQQIKAAKPDAQQKSHDAQQMAAATRDAPRVARRGWDPQMARNFSQWDD
jgi:hypothetical protein